MSSRYVLARNTRNMYFTNNICADLTFTIYPLRVLWQLRLDVAVDRLHYSSIKKKKSIFNLLCRNLVTKLDRFCQEGKNDYNITVPAGANFEIVLEFV